MSNMADAETLRFYPCQELVELVTEYLEDALSPSEHASFESHLAICLGCRNYVDQVRGTVTAIRHVPEDPVAPETRDRLLALFRAWKQGAEEP